MSKKKHKPPPFDAHVVNDPYAIVRGDYLGKWLVLGRTFCGYRAIGRQVHMDGVTPGVIHRVIAERQKSAYSEAENIACSSFLRGIKEEMLAHGATELAVQWVVDFEPTLMTEKDLKTMADKLQKKAPAKRAAKPKAKAKGNPEALVKAREASEGKRAQKRAMKIKALVKAKDLTARDPSFRRTMLTDLLGCKTVGEFYDMDAKYDAGCLNFAVKSEFVSLS